MAERKLHVEPQVLQHVFLPKLNWLRDLSLKYSRTLPPFHSTQDRKPECYNRVERADSSVAMMPAIGTAAASVDTAPMQTKHEKIN
jgi:hypothetical protein